MTDQQIQNLGDFLQQAPPHILVELKEFIGGVVQSEAQKVVKAAIKEELADYKHVCRFDITDKDAKELDHCIGMISDVGDGRLASGIEIIRDNHKWLALQRKRGDKMALAVQITLVSALVGGLCSAMYHGIKELFKK